MSQRQIELQWRCTRCQHRNRGRDKACTRCGDQKDASEPFEMPANTEAVASVTDPRLLEAARSGADWACAFCRAANGALGSVCVRCGARRGTAPSNTWRRATGGGAPAPTLGWTRRSWEIQTIAMVCIAFVALIVTGGALLLESSRDRQRDERDRERDREAETTTAVATVVSRSWETRLVESRYCLTEEQGFLEQMPPFSIEVWQEGVRHHHDDQVEDGTRVESYTESVPYSAQESTTESVRCGESCTSIPEICSERCTNNRNGFATCTKSCTGGGQRCTPRYCNETRSRSVTRTRQERRTRTVPKYRPVPRDAAWFHWRAYTWRQTGEARRSGTDEPPTRPDPSEIAPTAEVANLDCDETQYEESDTRSVEVRLPSGETVPYAPSSLDEMSLLSVGASLRVELDGRGNVKRWLDRFQLH